MEQSVSPSTPAASTLERQVGGFYSSFMDADAIERLGTAPIAQALKELRQATSRDALAALMGRNQTDFISTLFNYNIDVDLKDTQRYSFYLSQAGLGLPDRDYYLKPSFAPQKAAYQHYISTLLRLLNWPQAGQRAAEVVAFETRLAQASWSKAQQRDMVATYNPMTVDQLQAYAPGFNWKGMLGQAGMAKLQRVVIAEKSAFPQLVAIYRQTPIATIQAWHAFHIADNAAPYLPAAFVDAHFERHGKSLSGQQQQELRWKLAFTAGSGGEFGGGELVGTFGTLWFGVGAPYTARYFPPEVKTTTTAMVVKSKAAP